MNFQWIALFLVILGSAHPSLASQTPAQAQELYERVSDAREGTEWSCDTNLADAVAIFKTGACHLGAYSHSRMLTIRDAKVCASLGITCPFAARVSDGDFGVAPTAKYAYWATQGRNESTVLFASQSDGMMLTAIDNGSRIRPLWNQTWFFHAGACRR